MLVYAELLIILQCFMHRDQHLILRNDPHEWVGSGALLHPAKHYCSITSACGALGSTGSPASIQAFQPPRSARALR